MNLNSLYQDALGLSEANRLELVDLLLSRVRGQEQQAVRQAWMAEVDRRRELFLRGEVKAVSYDEVMRAASGRASS